MCKDMRTVKGPAQTKTGISTERICLGPSPDTQLYPGCRFECWPSEVLWALAGACFSEEVNLCTVQGGGVYREGWEGFDHTFMVFYFAPGCGPSFNRTLKKSFCLHPVHSSGVAASWRCTLAICKVLWAVWVRGIGEIGNSILCL